MKRDNLSNSDEDSSITDYFPSADGAPPKRFRSNDENENVRLLVPSKANQNQHIRLLVPSKIAGALIGKGGQNINRLRSEFKSTINVEDCQGPERTLNIAGTFENAMTVVEEMLKHFEEKDDELDCRLLIHQSLAGCVIGKAGGKIKEIRDKIGCHILKVFSNVCPQSSDRVVQCVGKANHCAQAIREIMLLIKDVPIKGPVMNYDPMNFDDMFSDKYGGFGEMSGGRGAPGYRESRFDRRPGDERGGYDRRGDDRGRHDRRDQMGSGSGRSSGRDSSRDFVDPWASSSGPASSSGYGSSSASQSRGSASSSNGFGDVPGEEKNSTQVTIPKDLAGAIIGKAGSRIRRIRMESNAFITIDEPLPGSADRIITITGSQKQIQMAQYLLQQSVHEHRQC